jgi:hypothetical protein
MSKDQVHSTTKNPQSKSPEIAGKQTQSKDQQSKGERKQSSSASDAAMGNSKITGKNTLHAKSSIA